MTCIPPHTNALDLDSKLAGKKEGESERPKARQGEARRGEARQKAGDQHGVTLQLVGKH